MRDNLNSGNMCKMVSMAAVVILTASLPACATSKGTKSASSFKVLEATQQTTLPGRGESPPFTTYRFRIVWKSKTSPSNFYWRPDKKNWLSLGREDLDKYGSIRYGDTLILTTRPDFPGKPVPSDAQKLPANSLYFQTSASQKWMYSPVSVKKLPDIALP